MRSRKQAPKHQSTKSPSSFYIKRDDRSVSILLHPVHFVLFGRRNCLQAVRPTLHTPTSPRTVSSEVSLQHLSPPLNSYAYAYSSTLQSLLSLIIHMYSHFHLSIHPSFCICLPTIELRFHPICTFASSKLKTPKTRPPTLPKHTQ